MHTVREGVLVNPAEESREYWGKKIEAMAGEKRNRSHLLHV